MHDSQLITGLIALSFALVHVLGRFMRFLRVTPRSVWLTMAGGVSLAYVFVHLLPELAASQEELLSTAELGSEGEGVHLYLVALAGLVMFYALERLARSHSQKHSTRSSGAPAFWLHLGSYALYSVLIGYLLVHREESDTWGLIIYALALGLHFVVNDQGLREHHGDLYDREGRWILALAPPLGWVLGQSVQVSSITISALFAFLAGGIVLNVLKEELPEDRESRLWALLVGASGFSALLLLAR